MFGYWTQRTYEERPTIRRIIGRDGQIELKTAAVLYIGLTLYQIRPNTMAAHLHLVEDLVGEGLLDMGDTR